MSNIAINRSLRVVARKISDLKPFERNNKIHDKIQVTQIANSIKEFGFNVPVLVDGDNNIIAGHGRVLACIELGITEIPTISLAHLTESQKRAYIIADNKLAANAEWNNEMLALEFKELEKLDLSFDLDITGFKTSEIDLITSNVAQDEEENIADILQIAENTKAVTKAGDIWQLGKHRIICGDSTKLETYRNLLGNKKASLVNFDPPYNLKLNKNVCGYGKAKHNEFIMASGEMSEAEYTQFIAQIFENVVLFSKDGSIHYVFMDWRHMYEVLVAGRKHYSELKNFCVWNKNNWGMGRFYRSQHELVFVFKNGIKKHTSNFELGKGGRARSNVWNYPSTSGFFTDSETGEKRGDLIQMHPTARPVAIIADIIRDCSKHGDIILEPFIGSGTAVIAAEKTARRCYGIDIEPKYIDVAVRRWQKITGGKAIHSITGKEFAN